MHTRAQDVLRVCLIRIPTGRNGFFTQLSESIFSTGNRISLSAQTATLQAYTAMSRARNVCAIRSDVTYTTHANGNLYLCPKNKKAISVAESNAKNQIYLFFFYNLRLFFSRFVRMLFFTLLTFRDVGVNYL